MPADNLDALFEPTTPAAPVVESPVVEAPTVTPGTPAAEVTPASPPGAWTPEQFDSWYNAKHPEAPEGIAKIEDWRTARTTAAKITRQLFEKEMTLTERESELAAARADLAAAKAAGGSGLPEAEAVKQLQAELAAERQGKAAELKEWNDHKAKMALESNHAFLAEFDGRRAAIKADAMEIATEAGISEDVVNAVLGASSKYQLTKALDGIEDAAAVKLLSDLGSDFIKLTAERETAVKNPVDHLKKWEDYNTAVQGNMAQGFRKQAVDTWTGAVPEAIAELGDDPFFKTQAGQVELAAIEAQITSGRLPNVRQSIVALAKAQSSDFYLEAWQAGRAEVARLKSELAKYSAADPGAVPTVPPARGTPSISGFDVERGW
jgi:hypothetical protein